MTRSIKSQNRKAAGKKKACGNVACTECAHARLIQYDNDPLLAECLRKPQLFSVRFPYQVEVARAKKFCEMYEHTDDVKAIQKRVKSIGVCVTRSASVKAAL